MSISFEDDATVADTFGRADFDVLGKYVEAAFERKDKLGRLRTGVAVYAGS